MRYVIWGAGLRGRRLFGHLKSDDVIAFVDKSTEKIGSCFCGKQVVSLEEYITNKEFSGTMLVIAHTFEQSAADELEMRGIKCYMKLSDCPGEFQEENTRPFLSDYIKRITNRNKTYGIWGNTVYALEVYSWLAEIGNMHSYLIIDENLSSEMTRFLEQSDYNTIYKNEVCKETVDSILNCKYIEETDTYCLFEGIEQENIYDCSDVIEEYYNSGIAALKNIHINEKCFIVATGPSLRVEDLDMLEKEHVLSFGVNKIGYAYEKTKWRPTFFAGEDRALIESEYFSSIKPEEQSEYAFLADTSECFWRERHKPSILKYHLCDEWAFGREPKFSEDLSRKSYVGGTIVYTCIQLAVYMGFKEIHLLGVDFTGANEHGSRYSHFYEEKELTSVSYTDQVKSGYEKARKYADEHGIKIYNATRGGKLEIFERVDFDRLFNA